MRGSLSAFSEMYPEIEFYVELSTRRVDLLTEPFDLELHVGPLPDSSLKARKIATIRPGIYASPKLLSRYPEPKAPQDFRSLPFVYLEMQTTIPLQLSDGIRTETLVLSSCKHVVSNPIISMEFILAGQCVGFLPKSVAAPYVASGELLRLLPEWQAVGVDVSLVMPPGRLPYRVRLFIDYLVEFFANLTK